MDPVTLALAKRYTDIAAADRIPLSQKGAADGVATLDAGGRPVVPSRGGGGVAARGGTGVYALQFTTASNSNLTGSASTTAKAVQLTPFRVTEPIVHVTSIAVSITVAGEAGSLVHLGIYRLDQDAPSDASPPTWTRVVDGGTVPGDGATGVKSVTIDENLTPGWYAAAVLVICPGGVPPQGLRMAIPSSGFAAVNALGDTALRQGFVTTAGFDALPASITGSLSNNGNAPALWFGIGLP